MAPSKKAAMLDWLFGHKKIIIFFSSPSSGRLGIDLHNFSWERIAIELDLDGEDNGQR